MATSNTLPEGTDSIIAGAGVLGDDENDLATGVPIDDRLTDTLAGDVDGVLDEEGGAAPRPRTSASGGIASGSPEAGEQAPQSLRKQAGDKVQELRGQATDHARDWVEQNKDRATDALDNVGKMISDAAAQVDAKIGSEYGDYARRAGTIVDGLANALREKDVEALFSDARELVRKSPAIAASAAALIGFVFVRVIKAGLDPQVADSVPANPAEAH